MKTPSKIWSVTAEILLKLSLCGGLRWWYAQSNFRVKPNLGWIDVELLLSWGFDNNDNFKNDSYLKNKDNLKKNTYIKGDMHIHIALENFPSFIYFWIKDDEWWLVWFRS